MRTPIRSRTLPKLPTLRTLALACAGAGLLACTSLRPEISPSAAPTDAPTAAADAYLAGRNHHLARRYDEARAAYQAALRADPQHVDARNGLATLHAEQRDFAAAVRIWRELTASLNMASGPGKAYLFGNLGHAYFLSGDYDQALVALEKACLLDPLNHRSWQLLGETLGKLGQEGRAAQMLRQAEALRRHDLRADLAAVGGRTPVAAIRRAADRQAEAPREEREWLQAELHPDEGGLLELRRGKDTPAPAPEPLAPDTPAPLEHAGVARLEIRNGNGVTGMARALARQLGQQEVSGLKVTRLSNHKGFAVRRTRIDYEAAFRAQAERLAERIDEVQLREVSDCAPANLRLVLGRDLPRRGLVLRPLDDAAPAAPAVGTASSAAARDTPALPAGAGKAG
ncbi:LytR C-terminal domain-containing protein [Massilia sp. KIM]|uniref:LytR C-terminal domain-containing protein n=1 Tax=Massilia sp. KIM TaxID=1955422 RepID=UPI0015C309E1|nr:LytR C-terminal domain-containing protein [Massilia sp. KIM]